MGKIGRALLEEGLARLQTDTLKIVDAKEAKSANARYIGLRFDEKKSR
jgi:hypothetical protein